MEKTFVKRSITEEMAHAMIRAAEEKAKEKGMKIAVAIVDEGANLVAVSRMDGAGLYATTIAQSKAHSAVVYGLPTEMWYPMTDKDPPLRMGAPFFPGLCTLGGGYPIKVDDYVIGGIGVSGGHWPEDIECARTGLDALTRTEVLQSA